MLRNHVFEMNREAINSLVRDHHLSKEDAHFLIAARSNSERSIKHQLEDRGIKVADLARRAAKDFGVKEKSADNMLRDLIAGRRWYPSYAQWLKDEYAITITAPEPFASVRERMKLAA